MDIIPFYSLFLSFLFYVSDRLAGYKVQVQIGTGIVGAVVFTNLDYE